MRIRSLLVVASLLAGAVPPGHALAEDDHPGSPSGAMAVSPTGQWLRDSIDAPTDVDWWRFSVTQDRYVWITLGDLPSDYDLSVHDAAGKEVATSSRAGRQPEEVYRRLSAGDWFVRVRAHSGSESARHPYALRFRELVTGVQVMPGWRAYRDEDGYTSVVGEVLNNTGQPLAPGRVTVSLRDKNGHQVTSTTAVEGIPPHARLPFHAGSAPAADGARVTLALDFKRAASSPVGHLSIALDPRRAGESFRGTVTNDNAFPVGSLALWLVQYTSYGNVRGVSPARFVRTGPVAPGSSAAFEVVADRGERPRVALVATARRSS